MKKILALILAIFMIVTFAACKKNQKDSTTNDSTSQTESTTDEDTSISDDTTDSDTTESEESSTSDATESESDSTSESTTEPEDSSTEPEETDEPDVLTPEGGNLAFGKPVLFSYAHVDTNWGWDPNAVTDGTLNEYDNANGGYHSSYGTHNHSDWVGIELGDGTKFDTVVIYPCRESHEEFDPKYCPAMPNAFRIEISDDGENWTVVYERYCYDIPEYGPQTFQFASVTAKYVRFHGISMNKGYNWAMKIAEFAVYDKNYFPEVVNTPENIAKDATVDSNSTHNTTGGPWNLPYINDGDRYNMNTSQYDHGQFAGYHSSPSTPDGTDIYLTFDFGTAKSFNQFVIYPSTEKYSTKQENKDDFYFPKNFKIEISTDGETWTTVHTVSDFELTDYIPVVVNFATQNARYARLVIVEKEGYIKLSEIEIYNVATTA